MRKCRLMFIAAFAAMLATPVLANGYGTPAPAYEPPAPTASQRCRPLPGTLDRVCDYVREPRYVEDVPVYAPGPVIHVPAKVGYAQHAYAPARGHAPQLQVVLFEPGMRILGRHRQHTHLCVCVDRLGRQVLAQCPHGFGQRPGGHNSGGHQVLAPIAAGVGEAISRIGAPAPQPRIAQPQVRHYQQPSAYRPQPIPMGGPQGGVMRGGYFR